MISIYSKSMTNIKITSPAKQFYFFILCLATKFYGNRFAERKVENIRYISLHFHGANRVCFQVRLYCILMSKQAKTNISAKFWTFIRDINNQTIIPLTLQAESFSGTDIFLGYKLVIYIYTLVLFIHFELLLYLFYLFVRNIICLQQYLSTDIYFSLNFNIYLTDIFFYLTF